MTATNHALTGAAIALVVKQPALAIGLALLSHFVIDAVPHYNPPQINKRTFVDYTTGWARKFTNKSFKIIFTTDMALLFVSMVALPFVLTGQVASWTIFACMLAAVSPDFSGGRFLIYKWLGIKVNEKPNSFFTRLHIWFQWMERPWGIWVELVWFAGLVVLISTLS